MPTPEERIAELGLTLPEVVPPLATYQPAVTAGSTVYVSGQLPMRDGEMVTTGKVGKHVSLEAATICARQCAMNAIGALRSQVPDLGRLRIVKLTVFVASTADFTDQAQVANGASELLGAIFGDAGVHARSAVGVMVLPLDAPVEVEVVAQVAGA